MTYEVIKQDKTRNYKQREFHTLPCGLVGLRWFGDLLLYVMAHQDGVVRAVQERP